MLAGLLPKPFSTLYCTWKSYKTKQQILSIIRPLIKEAQQNKGNKGIIYELLEHKEYQNIETIAAEVFLLLVAGYDTTTHTISFVIGELMKVNT